MPNKDPFAGMALSQQITPPKLDQRLFAPAATPDQPPAKPRGQPAIPSSALAPERKPALAESANLPEKSTPRFDLGDEPLYKATFIFTQQELEALEDLM